MTVGSRVALVLVYYHKFIIVLSFLQTASRNVAFKARRLSESIMESQDSFIMRDFEDAEVYFGDDGEEIVADVGNNADLYAANQGSTDLINEVYTEEAPLRSKSQDDIHQRPLSLD